MKHNHLSYRETIRKYWNTSGRSEEDLYKQTVKQWERIPGGYVSLYNKETRKQCAFGFLSYFLKFYTLITQWGSYTQSYRS